MKRVAILGASQLRHKFGNKSVRAHQAAGWDVVPVNLSGEQVEGLTTYRTLADIPGELHRISVYLPPPVTLALLPEIAERPAAEIWFNPGAADSAVRQKARELNLRTVDGCSIVDVGFSPAQFP
jgi:hypothetical protein